ncbi:MAG: hypothetical protein M3220_02045 [Chloroflexota bacterium]|nr:hypothetical protein [Chloroflexota bacterium]
MNNIELVMYGRTYACWDQSRAMAFLAERNVPYRFVDISRDSTAAHHLQSWVGHLSVPTLVVAQQGDIIPVAEPEPLDRSRRIRGQNRGTLITEPDDLQLEAFLQQHNLL